LTTTTVAGLTLEELAQRRLVTVREAHELVRPFLEVGIVEERDGGLRVVDREIVFAFSTEETPPA
jgi:hypothetical protein